MLCGQLMECLFKDLDGWIEIPVFPRGLSGLCLYFQ